MQPLTAFAGNYRMQIGELKKMLKKSTAVLILENGEPSIVVVDYNTYRELLGDPDSRTSGSGGATAENPEVTLPGGSTSSPGEIELLERINKDILALKEQIEEEEKGLDI